MIQKKELATFQYAAHNQRQVPPVPAFGYVCYSIMLKWNVYVIHKLLIYNMMCTSM